MTDKFFFTVTALEIIIAVTCLSVMVMFDDYAQAMSIVLAITSIVWFESIITMALLGKRK